MKFKLDIFDMTNIFHHKWETEAECSLGVSYVTILIIHIHIYCLFIPQTALSEKDLSQLTIKHAYKEFNKIKIENQDRGKNKCFKYYIYTYIYEASRPLSLHTPTHIHIHKCYGLELPDCLGKKKNKTIQFCSGNCSCSPMSIPF